MGVVSEHIPVLSKEVLGGLKVRPGGRYVDATIGGGGHASDVLKASSPDGLILGLDADPEAVDLARKVLRPFGERVILRNSNFRNLKSTPPPPVESDGIPMDSASRPGSWQTPLAVSSARMVPDIG
jgi:16S rRNA C1402 N4-methylase RsmH